MSTPRTTELLFHGLEPPPVRDGRWTPRDDIPGPAAPREGDPLFQYFPPTEAEPRYLRELGLDI